MSDKRPTFEQACAKYVHRFTMEFVPRWANQRPIDSGGTDTRYHAPQYRTDREWYENTTFPGEPAHFGPKTHANSSGQTWPLGNWLMNPYVRK